MLCDALMSIQAQTVTDWECLVVVDGGDPPPIPCDERIRIEVRAANGGAGAARNTGIARSSGAYVTFLDDDDTWLPERLELAAEALDRAPVSVCYGLSDGVVAWKATWEGDVADTHADYFATHRRAAARCWAHYAEMAHYSGLRRQAVLAYARALRHQPSSGLARAGLRAVRIAEPDD